MVTTLSVNEMGLLDTIKYLFLGDVDRNNSDLKMISTIRITMGYYVFEYCYDNVFKITPTKCRLASISNYS
ncbi:hypothetical protein LFU01_11840 [Lysinibacillus fusiformis]|nr:hypothetical protein LFU01_11840 [Lysinibacillus fusiformis]SFS91758.1 hypothetical protein SAMN02787099_02016 [Lysinibacillus fusiformis]